MALIQPRISITLFPGKKNGKKDEEQTPEPTIDFAALEEAAVRIGKKLVVGTIVVSVSTVAAATVGAIVLEAAKHNLNK